MKRVGIIRGGTGENYKASLKKGGELIAYITDNLGDKYKTFDILIDKEGNWHINGVLIKPAELMPRVDLVWNTAHPGAALILNALSIPNLGQSSFHAGLETSREMLREHMKNFDVKIPRQVVIPLYQADFDGPRERYSIKKAKEVFEKFSSPWIVKSFAKDESMGIHLAKTFDELVGAIEDGVKHGGSILVEEFVAGKVASVHSVRNFRNEDVYAFPLVKTFGEFKQAEKEKLFTLVKNLHEHLGAGSYLKSDLIMTPRGRVYLFGTQSHPNLYPQSHFAEVCELAGENMRNVVEHILENAF